MSVPINPILKSLYVDLLRLRIADYLPSEKFEDFCRVNNIYGLWDQCIEQVQNQYPILVVDEKRDAKDALIVLLGFLFKDRDKFIKILGTLLVDFQEWSSISKDFSEIKKDIFELGFSKDKIKWVFPDKKDKSTTTEKPQSTSDISDEKLQKIITRIDKLIKLGNSVLATQQPLVSPPSLMVDSGLFIQWKTKTLSFFTSILGSNHVYTQDFTREVKSAESLCVERGLGILNAVRSDAKEGILNMKHAEIQGRIQSQSKTRGIVISHASQDEYIASQFLDDIIIGCFNFNTVNILCTSVEGFKIESGEDWRKYVRNNLLSAKVIFLLITPNYKSSEMCLNEMGAAWATNATVIPMIIKPITFKSVGVLPEIQQVEFLTDETGLDRMKDRLQKIFALPDRSIPSDRWTTKKREFLSKINTYLTDNPFPTPLSIDVIEDLQIKCKNMNEEKHKLKTENERLEKIIKEIEKTKDSREVIKIKNKYQNRSGLDNFEKLAQKVKDKFKGFHSAVIKILYNDYTGNNLTVNYNAYERNIEDAIARNYLTRDLDVLWQKTKKLQEMHDTLDELRSFIHENYEDEDFLELYEKKYSAPFNINNLTFWEEVLNLYPGP